MKDKKEMSAATWTMTTNALYFVECPHCKNTMLMSKEPLIKRLVKWAKQLPEVF